MSDYRTTLEAQAQRMSELAEQIRTTRDSRTVLVLSRELARVAKEMRATVRAATA